MRKLTPQDVERLVSEVALTVPPEFGVGDAMVGVLDVMASASERLSEKELASLLGAAGILCRIGTRASVDKMLHPEGRA